MHSMTGFGSAQSGSPFYLHVAIRSVNGRFLEPRFHMGREFFELEADLKKHLSQQVERGTVDVYISKKKRVDGKREAKVDTALAASIVKSARKAAKELKLKAADLNLSEVLNLPGVLEVDEEQGSSEAERKALTQTFHKAVQQLVGEKAREGRALQKVLLEHLRQLQSVTKELQKLRGEANEDLERRLTDRIAQKNSDPIEPSRLAQELIFYLDRSDINEEIHRLQEHLETCKNLLSSHPSDAEKTKAGKVGKKLDFFAQELLREINTIGSKANLAVITRRVVEAKTLVETIREQVQNIE